MFWRSEPRSESTPPSRTGAHRRVRSPVMVGESWVARRSPRCVRSAWAQRGSRSVTGLLSQLSCCLSTCLGASRSGSSNCQNAVVVVVSSYTVPVCGAPFHGEPAVTAAHTRTCPSHSEGPPSSAARVSDTDSRSGLQFIEKTGL